MAKVKLIGRRTRMVFGRYMYEGHVLNMSDSQARTLEGDADFEITGLAAAHDPHPALPLALLGHDVPQQGEERPVLGEEKIVVKKKRSKKK